MRTQWRRCVEVSPSYRIPKEHLLLMGLYKVAACLHSCAVSVQIRKLGLLSLVSQPCGAFLQNCTVCSLHQQVSG